MHKRVRVPNQAFLPCYEHLRDDSTIDIDFIYGSRDSGKSRDTAQRLVVKCLSEPYFRHILARKTFNTIKDSQWQVIKDVVDEWGLGDFFTFTQNPLAINCINGNKFLARGFDDPQQIKSIQNPSGAWVEEGNQLTAEDWIVLITSLRSNKGRTKIDFTFNPECEGDYEDFWLWKEYFSHTEDLSFTATKKISFSGAIHTITYRATHTTYLQNPYCTPQRAAVYEDLRKSNPYFYRVYALGLWGKPAVGNNPFAVHYEPLKHESLDAVLSRDKILTISIDFNLIPFAVSLQHIWRDARGEHHHIVKELDVPGGSIPALITLLWDAYDYWLPTCQVTGDSSGNNGQISVEDQRSNFESIRLGLKLAKTQIVVPSKNPLHKVNRTDVNYFLQFFPDFKINPKTCPETCWDMRAVQCDNRGTIIKTDRKDKSQRADYMDTVRYSINTFQKDWIERDRRIRK